jgi:hypothetical protein
MSPAKRWLLKLAHTVHVYVTLFGLVLILFFAVTGFILNHEDWFGLNTPQTWSSTGTIPPGLLEPMNELAIVELLRKEYRATGEARLVQKPDRIEVTFKGPGRKVDVEIEREDGKMTLTYEVSGVIGLLTDLHKGKSTGLVWPWVVDGVCVLLLVISATGLVLWWSLRSRGRFGLVAIGLGLMLTVVIYYVWVPWW